MNSFADKNGKKWMMNVNVGSSMRVKAITEVDILNIIKLDPKTGADTDALQALIEDPYKMVFVLHTLCSGHDGNDDLPFEQFAEIFDANSIDAAADCIIREIIDFSHPAKRKLLTLLYQKTREYKARVESQVDEIVKSKEFNEEIDEQLNKLLLNSEE